MLFLCSISIVLLCMLMCVCRILIKITYLLTYLLMWPAQFGRKLVLGTRRKWPRPRSLFHETETLTIFLETRPRRDVSRSRDRDVETDRDHNPAHCGCGPHVIHGVEVSAISAPQCRSPTTFFSVRPLDTIRDSGVT